MNEVCSMVLSSLLHTQSVSSGIRAGETEKCAGNQDLVPSIVKPTV